jgi:hypothetical protein
VNGDPLITGAESAFPNQNSSSAPTTWEEDIERAAREGIPCGPGPMLRLVKRSTSRQFLPGGELNPCAERAPSCLEVESRRVEPGRDEQRLAAALIAVGLVGGSFVGGRPGAPGLGVAGVGAPGDGVRGVSTAPIGTAASGHGVIGLTTSGKRSDAGVQGEAGSGGVGVRGESFTGSGTGVEGRGSRVGIRGDGRGGRVGGIGVEGIPGPLTAGFRPWAGAFRGSVLVEGNASILGSVNVFGSKSAVVPHPDGSARALYAVESPESWFEDFGRADLIHGRAHVELEPEFGAVAQAADDYHVFLTPEGESNGLFVTNRTPAGFDVLEQQGGAANVSFSYRLVTRRRDVEAARLARVELPPPGPDEEPIEPTDPEASSSPPPGWPSESLAWPPYAPAPTQSAGETE